MRSLIFYATLLFHSLASATQNSQEIRVHLPTKSPLHPIYVNKLQIEESDLSATHLKALENILFYDLNYNGSTKVCASSTEKEQLLLGKNPSSALNPATWKDFGICYVIKWHVAHKKIYATLLNAQTGSIKSFNAIALCGDLKEDRKQIHKLADSVYKALFNKNGVASSRILFAFQVKNPHGEGKEWISEIWECDWDGGNLREVTHEKSYCVNPVLLPRNCSYDNESFLYVSYKKGQPKIYIATLNEGIGRRLIDLRGNQLLPAISSARDKIAFICDAAGRTDLFVQPLNPLTGEMGKPYQLYSYPRSTQASPTFSPDGSKIAFVSDKDGSMRIYMISATPSKKRQNAIMLSKQNRENSCPAWSPDGTKLAYSAKTNGVRQIWIYDLQSKEEWQLTSGPGNKENPAWAPNAEHIVFNSTDEHSSELYIVNLNQPEAIKISQGPGKKHYPTWGTR